MFYAQLILAKKGLLGKVWLAAHWDKKLNRQVIFQTDVTKSAESIAHPKEAMPLRVSGSLLLGVVRIFSHKVKYLSTDCEMALSKMKMAFRPGVDPSQESIDDENWEDEEGMEGGGAGEGTGGGCTRSGRNHQEHHRQQQQQQRRQQQMRARESFTRLTLDVLPPMATEWLESAAQTMARKQDITMDEGDHGVGPHVQEKVHSAAGSNGGHHHFHAGSPVVVENWEAFDPGKLGIEDKEDDDDGMMEIQNGESRSVSRPGRYEKDDDDGYHDDDGGGMMDDDYMGGDDGGGGMDDDDDFYGNGDAPEVARCAANGGSASEETGSKLPEGSPGSLDLNRSLDKRVSILGRASGVASTIGDMDQDDGVAMLIDEEEPALILGGEDGEASIGHIPAADLKKRDSIAAKFLKKGNDKRGKKRPLPIDLSLQISGAQMKEQLADYSSLVVPRIRPRDRFAGSSKNRKVLDPVEVRLTQHTLSGTVGSDIEEMFTLVMKPLPHYKVDVAKRKEAREKEQLLQQKKTAAEKLSPSKNNKAPAMTNGHVEGEEEEGHLENGLPPYGGGDDGMIMEDDDHFDFGGDNDGYHGGEYGDDNAGGESEREGDEAEDDEDEEDDFIRTNAADDDGAVSGSSTKWHPNTVKMCKLLRTRMTGKDHVKFAHITHNNRRTKAANKFFEILQLKTWDFIQVHQDQAYDDIKVTAAARFHEAIPR